MSFGGVSTFCKFDVSIKTTNNGKEKEIKDDQSVL